MSFSWYIGRNLGEYFLENTLQLRSWGSDVEVSAAATLLHTTVVIYTACTETIRRWLSYKPTNESEERIYLRNLC